MLTDLVTAPFCDNGRFAIIEFSFWVVVVGELVIITELFSLFAESNQNEADNVVTGFVGNVLAVR